MKNIIFVILAFLVGVIAGLWASTVFPYRKIQGLANIIEVPKPLLAYTIDSLSRAEFYPSELRIKEELANEEEFSSHLFEMEFAPNPNIDQKKKVTGLINIPKEGEIFPLIIMIRGFVSQEIYETGVGTKNSGEYFAGNGFITVAPDFLGYGGSDIESSDIFEARFQTYTTVFNLIKSLEENGLPLRSGSVGWDKKNIFIWAHSNGGQIALTYLSASGKNIPTTLWAPVTKAFPYSVLYYTDESLDRGKFIRKELANFEAIYEVDEFSFTNYLSKINAPIVIHQGTNDDAVPWAWSSSFASVLKSLDKKAELTVHSGADHNMRPSWDDAISADLEFFRSFIVK